MSEIRIYYLSGTVRNGDSAAVDASTHLVVNHANKHQKHWKQGSKTWTRDTGQNIQTMIDTKVHTAVHEHKNNKSLTTRLCNTGTYIMVLFRVRHRCEWLRTWRVGADGKCSSVLFGSNHDTISCNMEWYKGKRQC